MQAQGGMCSDFSKLECLTQCRRSMGILYRMSVWALMYMQCEPQCACSASRKGASLKSARLKGTRCRLRGACVQISLSWNASHGVGAAWAHRMGV